MTKVDCGSNADLLLQKLKRQIKKEKSRTGWKKFFWFLVLLAAAVAGEVFYNTPERKLTKSCYLT